MAEIHTLTVFFQNGTNLRLGYLNPERARQHHGMIEKTFTYDSSQDPFPRRPSVTLEDDFGNVVTILERPLAADLVDRGRGYQLDADLALMRLHAQVKLQDQVSKDPVLNRPGIIKPGLDPFAPPPAGGRLS